MSIDATTATTSATDPFAALRASAAAAGTDGSNPASADTFLKLLVTQLQNQDPLNPMDNSQMTSQLAQIQTVNGISTLNTTVQGLNAQFVQMQALQGASLVGHGVVVQGNQLEVSGGQAAGGIDLAGPADDVSVQILSPAGLVVDTMDLGAQSTGRLSFSWPATGVADGTTYTFKVSAKSGAATVGATPLMRDVVTAVSVDGSGLSLQTLYSGSVPYAQVKAFD